MKVIDVVMRLRDNVSGGLTRIRNNIEQTSNAAKRLSKAWLKLAKAFMR